MSWKKEHSHPSLNVPYSFHLIRTDTSPGENATYMINTHHNRMILFALGFLICSQGFTETRDGSARSCARYESRNPFVFKV